MIDTEIGSGQRVAVVTARNLTTGLVSYTSIPVELIQNEAPSMVSIGLYDHTGQEVAEVTKAEAPARTVIRYSGTATDPNNDVLYFKWSLTPPTAPTSMTLYGRDAYLDVSDWTGSADGITYDLLGRCIAVDRFGVESAPMSIPQVIIKA